jgi:threonine/homoserine/homoserine lactone efflux protein
MRKCAVDDAARLHAQGCQRIQACAAGNLMTFVPNPLVIPVGIIIGVLITAPLGPINVLSLQRAVERGFWGGVAAGLGVALGDGLIALLAALGVNAVSGAVRHHRFAIQSVGGIVLLLFAVRLFFTEPRIDPGKGSGENASLGDFAWDIPQMFFLTITNPGAVLGLFAIFSGVGTFVELETHVDVLTMVAAIMGGSLVSWITLSKLISGIRHRLDLNNLRLINRAAGVLMFGFGLMLLGEVVMKGPAIVPG